MSKKLQSSKKIKAGEIIYLPKGVKVGRSKAGLGLFAKEEIKKGDFIIEYFGKTLNHEEAEYHPGKYLFEINSKITIDGSTRKNIARYINHSCRPNCEVDIKKGRILIFACKNIKIGEELNYDYDDEYFDEFFLKNGCFCGKCPKYRLKKVANYQNKLLSKQKKK